MMPDIETEDDIKSLVDSFYEKIRDDELLRPIFYGAIGDNWDEHLPVIYRFWSSLLIHQIAFAGQPYPKHAVLPLAKVHFDRWLYHFGRTVDSQFQGATADKAKRTASQIATAFMYKMGLVPVSTSSPSR